MPPTSVLFLCIGNSCRSPMAEGFARAYGSDIVAAQSAGLAPATGIAPLTLKVMGEKNVDLSALFPKGIKQVKSDADLIVNMSGYDLPFKTKSPVEEWDIRDPIGESEEVYREVRDEIEQRVKQLLASMRARKPAASEYSNGADHAARVDTRKRPPRK